eukprot:5312848-Pleurochrysis_carterae.AAC.1
MGEARVRAAPPLSPPASSTRTTLSATLPLSPPSSSTQTSARAAQDTVDLMRLLGADGWPMKNLYMQQLSALVDRFCEEQVPRETAWRKSATKARRRLTNTCRAES